MTFLFDLTPSDEAVFELQKERVRDVIRHLETSTANRLKSYSLIGFHRRPVSLLELASTQSEDLNTFLAELSSLQNVPQLSNETSVAKAIHAAVNQFLKDGRANSQRLLFLIHDGVNTDLVAETIESVEMMRRQNISLFALSAGARPNGFALQGYTGQRSRVYSHRSDEGTFEESLDMVIGSCPSKISSASIQKIIQSRRFAIRAMDSPRRTRKFSKDQGCDTNRIDLMIVLDTSGSVHDAFTQERDFAINLIDRFDEKAFKKNIQVSVIRFADDVEIVIPFSRNQSKEDILKAIRGIEFTGSQTRIAAAVEIGIDHLERYQRTNAQQIFVLISDGHGQEFWNVVQATGRKLQENEWEIFSVTASEDYNLEELKLYTGDEGRVFIGPKTASFLPIVGSFIDRCIVKKDTENVEGSGVETTTLFIEPSEPKASKNKEIEGSAEEVEGSGQETTTAHHTVTESPLVTEETLTDDMNCDLDIVLVVDRSQSVETDYKEELKTAQDVVNLASKEAFKTGKVRVGATSFAKDGRVELDLEKNERDEVMRKIGDIYHTGGSTSIVNGIRKAIKYLLPKRRPKAKVLLILISDGHSQDFWRDLISNARKIQTLPNSLFLAATNSEHYSLNELGAWTGGADNVYHSRQIPHFLERIQKEMRKCGAVSKKSDKLIAKVISKFEKKEEKLVEGSGIEGSGEVEGSGEIEGSGGIDIITTDNVIEKSSTKRVDEGNSDQDSHKEKTRGITEALLTGKGGNVEKIEKNSEILLTNDRNQVKKTAFDGTGFCKVDLVFVIDISTSVEEEFEKQRQFTIDLVKRLPEEDFESRIRVGIIAFHNRARVVEPLGRQKSRDSILEVLGNLVDEGGSTAVADGMRLASEEMKRGRRHDARQMMVLVSDGNSQDLWRDVILTSEMVKRLGVDVYAVTVHRNYLYRELEMYATNEHYVYVDAKIRQFLDETERALRKCLSPTVQG